MSTEINITVEGENLSDVARRNQQQNRQNEEQRRQQEKKAKRQAAEEAEQKKQEEQKKAAGSGTSNKYRPDEPAAFRSQNEYMLLKPTEPPNANQWFDPFVSAVLPLQTRGKYPQTVTSGTSNNAGPARPTYYASGGPGNAAMLGAVPASNYNYVTLSGSQSGVASDRVRKFTLQLYFRFGETLSTFQPYPEVLVEFGKATSSNNISMFFNLETQATQLKTLTYRIGNTYLYSRKVESSDTSTPALRPGTWHHVALTMIESKGYAFFDGVLIAEQVLPFSAIDIRDGVQLLKLYFGHTAPGVTPGQTVYVQGLKYEPLCRWRASFTPPPFIQ
jgi:hypothetical protein